MTRTLIASLLLLGATGAANAASSPRSPSGQPSVHEQIKQTARQERLWGDSSSLRLQFTPGGRRVNASLHVLSTFGGGARRLAKPTRQTLALATFKVHDRRGGQVLEPIRQNGRVWSVLARAFAH
jgi:hypothetical protein